MSTPISDKPRTAFVIKHRSYLRRKHITQCRLAQILLMQPENLSRKLNSDKPIDCYLVMQLVVFYNLSMDDATEFCRLAGYDISSDLPFFEVLRRLVSMRMEPYAKRNEILKEYGISLDLCNMNNA